MTSKDFKYTTNHRTADSAVFKAALRHKTFGTNEVKHILKLWKAEMGSDVIAAALKRAEESKYIVKDKKQWKSLIS